MKVSVTAIGHLLAAVPAMLGFVPVASTVFALARDEELVMAARVDWPGTDQVVATIVDVARRHAADTVFIIAISSEIEAYDLAGLAAVEFDAIAMTAHPIAVAAIGEAVQWQHLITGERGLTEDYQTSALTTAMATETGMRIVASRDELTRAYATTDAVPMGAAEQAASSGQQFAAAVAAEVVEVATGQRAATDAVAARFGYLVATQIVARDALLWMLRTAPADAAAYLQPLAAPLRGEYRAQVLTVVAVLWALAGRGPAVTPIIETVEREELPIPSMLALLERAVHAGAPPSIVGTALTAAMDDATAAQALGGYRRP